MDSLGRYEVLGAEIGAQVDKDEPIVRARYVMHELLLDYYDADRDLYEIPRALMAQIPTLTCIVDKLIRIVSKPSGDRLGEHYRDIAGYAMLAVGREEAR